MVDVGGHSLHLQCQGDGSPTILIIHGIWLNSDLGSSPAAYYGPLPSMLGREAHTCLYERANVGRSDTIDETQTTADSVADLRALVDVAGIPGPYLLVGESFGGIIAIQFAAAYPADVVGMVFSDASLPTDEQIDNLIPEPDRSELVAELDVNAENLRYYDSLHEAGAVIEMLPDVPITYLAASDVDLDPSWPVEAMLKQISDYQQAFVDAQPQGRLVRVDSDHTLPPQVIADEVTRMIVELR